MNDDTRFNPARKVSFRGRVLGPVTEMLLKPVMAMPAERMRPRLERIARLITRVPLGTRIRKTSLGGVPGDELLPRKIGSDIVILYFHGGAYLGGSPRSHRGMLARLARAAGCRINAIDYRLAPEHPFPGALEDAVTAYQALLAEGIESARIILAGDSAGGNLTLITALALRDAGLPKPGRLLLLSPWTDLGASGASMKSRESRERILTVSALPDAARQFAGKLETDDPRLSPLFADLHDLPPMFLQVGDDEILLDDSLRLAEAAKAAGGSVTLQVWPGMWHVWQILAGSLPEADRAIAEMAAFCTARR